MLFLIFLELIMFNFLYVSLLNIKALTLWFNIFSQISNDILLQIKSPSDISQYFDTHPKTPDKSIPSGSPGRVDNRRTLSSWRVLSQRVHNTEQLWCRVLQEGAGS